MANSNDPFAPRPMDEVKKELHERAKHNRNPFLYTLYDEIAPVIDRLESVDREAWANAFGAMAAPHEERAAKAEAGGDRRCGAKGISDRLRLLPRCPLSRAELAGQAGRL